MPFYPFLPLFLHLKANFYFLVFFLLTILIFCSIIRMALGIYILPVLVKHPFTIPQHITIKDVLYEESHIGGSYTGNYRQRAGGRSLFLCIFGYE